LVDRKMTFTKDFVVVKHGADIVYAPLEEIFKVNLSQEGREL
jgi:hypothetical protein